MPSANRTSSGSYGSRTGGWVHVWEALAALGALNDALGDEASCCVGSGGGGCCSPACV